MKSSQLRSGHVNIICSVEIFAIAWIFNFIMSQGDQVALLSAFSEMGLKLRLDMPDQAMSVASLFFRSSTPSNEALVSKFTSSFHFFPFSILVTLVDPLLQIPLLIENVKNPQRSKIAKYESCTGEDAAQPERSKTLQSGKHQFLSSICLLSDHLCLNDHI